MSDQRTVRSIRALVFVALVTSIVLATVSLVHNDIEGTDATVRAPAAGMTEHAYATATEPAFPRTATYVLDQDKLPPVEQLARYDTVVVDAEWQNRVPAEMFADLRRRSPGIKILAYVNPVDSMPRTGSPEYWANAYSLWQFTDSTHSRFPRQWLAYTASGQPVSEWNDHVMVNLADVAPKVNGQIYAEYVANWIVDRIWSTGLWDGIFLDVWADRLWTANKDAWDIDGDGKDEPTSEIYGAGGPLDRGLIRAETIMRNRMPNALLIANGDRTLSGQLLNGQVFESFGDRLNYRRHEITDLVRYVDAQTNPGLRPPIIGMNINLRRGGPAGSPVDMQRARFFLTMTLMQNGWWAPMGEDYGITAYYDEMDGGGKGRGYLGMPVVPNPTMEDLSKKTTTGTGSPAAGVFRRDFERGIAVVNVGEVPQKVDLGGRYRHLSGTGDPVVNNGQVVDSVTIPARDGVILLRED